MTNFPRTPTSPLRLVVLLVISVLFGAQVRRLEAQRPRSPEEAAERLAASDGADLWLEAPEGVRVETPVVWVPSLRQAGWRVALEAPGEYELVVHIGEETLTKSVRVAGTTELRSPVRASGLSQVIWPAEAPLPRGSSAEAITVSYADAEINLLGWHTHWLIAFFILTMVFAFALAKPMGVKI